MHKIYVRPSGGLGNVLFGYMASKVLQKILGYEISINKNELQNSVTYTDFHWFNNLIVSGHDIYMYGYFQNCLPYVGYKEYLRSLFNEDNKETIITHHGRLYNIADIVKPSTHTYDNEIVMHIRLSDLGGIVHPQHYLDILKDYNGYKLTIVTDRLNYDYEKKYIEYFKDFNPEIKSTTILEDFNYLRNAKIVILSNSSFAYMAGFLGNNEKVYMLYNDCPQQLLHTTGNNNCTSIKIEKYYEYVKPDFNEDYYIKRDFELK